MIRGLRRRAGPPPGRESGPIVADDDVGRLPARPVIAPANVVSTAAASERAARRPDPPGRGWAGRHRTNPTAAHARHAAERHAQAAHATAGRFGAISSFPLSAGKERMARAFSGPEAHAAQRFIDSC
ncbi:hypothetical protein ACRUKS_13650 [Burkholderia pseudomallei]|uniref:hypothetical protein n=1 Tax=Burkholderia pseudomallei TaxID=28450 RepID=UPI00015E1577|nr:hypothetical protein [Burkholderia pseudomallei]EDO84993.1 hypothetical protein BURPS406E_H0792 [Burkholderia pseudomallei 406e]KAA8767237.1 hypothetical protein F5D26_16305 [Burkholderia pseudomallei]KGW80249.1 hypothetical protein Y046_6081 [Burkholderia pseudomallei MSHR2990]KGX55745.1 hypothetical protein Y027_3961 [Burkholderia pseudomallei TSV5]MBD2983200.1 hypothetical protein [Burkholderia pseudomallei]